MKAKDPFTNGKTGVSNKTPLLNDSTISPEVLRWTIIGVILLIVLVHIGFSRSGYLDT